MHKNNYSLEVLINGRPAQEYYKDQKSFIESRNGTEYTLRFRNNSWKRVMAIFSVDGVEVLKGKAANEADTGYIVDAFSNIEVKGYRIDENNVATFKFTDTAGSYAAVVGATKKVKTKKNKEVEVQVKTQKNNGVIGVRVFEEDIPDRSYSRQNSSFPSYTLGNGSINYYISGCAGLGAASAASGIVGNIVSYANGGAINSLNQIFSSSKGRVLRADYNSSRGAGGCSSKGVDTKNYPHREYNETNLISINYTDQNGNNNTLNIPRVDINQYGNLERIDSIPDLPSQGTFNGVQNYSSGGLVAAAAPQFDTGSTWGTKTQDKVKEVTFKRSTTSTDIAIYYSSRQSLESWGIDFSRTKQIFAWPTAFEDKKEYCKTPPGYQG